MTDRTKKSNAAASTTTKVQIGRPFPPGQSGNPAGRPKGSRNRLGEDFISALQADFRDHGPETIAEVRKSKPHEYLKVVASILPKQLEIKDGLFDDLPNDELAALITAARAALGVAPEGGNRVTDQAGSKSVN